MWIWRESNFDPSDLYQIETVPCNVNVTWKLQTVNYAKVCEKPAPIVISATACNDSGGIQWNEMKWNETKQNKTKRNEMKWNWIKCKLK